MISIPAFGELHVTDHQENGSSRSFIFENVEKNLLNAYGMLLEADGFCGKEFYQKGEHFFAAYAKGNIGVFLNYYAAIRELSLVWEENCPYFSYEDTFGEETVSPQITQISLEDFGMSYAIRLSDGRFIVIDGGREFEPDSDRLFQCLKEGTGGEKPVIAAWIMTHPHPDHFHCFIDFFDRYGERVVFEKFMFNFPEADDISHYPKLARKDPRFEDSSPLTNIPRMLERIGRSGAIVYTAHTGQRYQIGDAACEILASMDDTIHLSKDINATSLVVRMELGGQVILWTADASFSAAKLPEKYGSYLKSDILQVPHHGFQSGAADSIKRGYDLIRPSVCLLPVSEYNAFTVICSYKESTRYLFTEVGVDEIITGDEQRTLFLPYKASPHAKERLQRQYLSGLDNGGAQTWVYSDLHTSRAEDFEFTLLNMTAAKATVWIELFFESSAQKIRNIKAEVPSGCIRKINIVGEDVDGDALYFNWLSLKEQGIPEDVPFAVRFMSDIPIVVSHQKHEVSYRTSVNR